MHSKMLLERPSGYTGRTFFVTVITRYVEFSAERGVLLPPIDNTVVIKGGVHAYMWKSCIFVTSCNLCK